MKKDTTVYIGELKKEEIEALKKQHKIVFAIKVDNHIGYFREADWADLNIAETVTDKDNVYEWNRNVMRETFLGGSAEVYDNPKYYAQASRQLNVRTNSISSSLEEL